MPWNTTRTTEQRLKFVTLANSGRFNINELCEQFGISRKCGHKWLAHIRRIFHPLLCCQPFLRDHRPSPL